MNKGYRGYYPTGLEFVGAVILLLISMVLIWFVVGFIGAISGSPDAWSQSVIRAWYAVGHLMGKC